jgi:hypothetical protein
MEMFKPSLLQIYDHTAAMGQAAGVPLNFELSRSRKDYIEWSGSLRWKIIRVAAVLCGAADRAHAERGRDSPSDLAVY